MRRLTVVSYQKMEMTLLPISPPTLEAKKSVKEEVKDLSHLIYSEKLHHNILEGTKEQLIESLDDALAELKAS